MIRHENGEEISPGLWLYRPGEKVPAWGGADRQPRKPAPGRGPLDSPAPPITRLVGRRTFTVGEGGW